jgi:hypothetical protein
MLEIEVYPKVAQIFQKTRSILKTQWARRVTWSKFRIEDPQTLEATVQNSVAMATGICAPLV